MIDFQKSLNPEQYAAVTHGDGPQLVIAGAGSGKTRAITYRIAWLIQERGVDPRAITAVTFTNKAAAEMKERVEALVGLHPLPAFVGTFHRYSLRMLRMYGDRLGLPKGFAIFDSGDQQSLIKKAVKAEGLDEKSFRPQAVLAAISGAKNRLIGPAEYERKADDFFRRRVAPVYRRYQKLLRDGGGVDFDDMIALSVQLLRQHEDLQRRIRRRAQHLLVDEFQDTNHAQLSLIRELVGTGGNLTAVGDEDQGIYRWRGAELQNILHFEDGFPGAEIRKLERNYRSTQNILDASGAVVANNQHRRGKTLWTEAGDGDPLTLYRGQDERDEARWVVQTLRAQEQEFRLSDTAVLVRTNFQTRALEDELLRQGMVYNLVGGVRFYERAEIKDLVAYLRLLRNPDDDFSLDRILNRPARGIGKTTHQRLQKRAEESEKSQWQVLADEDFEGVSKRSVKALLAFRDLICGLLDEAQTLPLPSLLQRILEATDYVSLYDQQNDDDRSRLENIDEFLSATQEFAAQHGYGSEEEDLLTSFLDHVSLASDTDGLGRKQGPSLMTLHSAKGLEFSAVILAGLEEKILPHSNSMLTPEDLEEERRLMYVGMTRARKRLFLSTCRRRQIAGMYQDQEESRFLEEIPADKLVVEESPELFRRPGGGQRPGGRARSDVYGFFGKAGRNNDPSIEPVADDSPADLPALQVDEIGSTKSRGKVRKGSRVRHATLGVGQVFRIDGDGDNMRLIVYFQGVGRRTLLAKFAKLEVLS